MGMAAGREQFLQGAEQNSNIFITLSLGCPPKICVIKTLLEKKNSVGKNSNEGKRVQYPL